MVCAYIASYGHTNHKLPIMRHGIFEVLINPLYSVMTSLLHEYLYVPDNDSTHCVHIAPQKMTVAPPTFIC